MTAVSAQTRWLDACDWLREDEWRSSATAMELPLVVVDAPLLPAGTHSISVSDRKLERLYDEIVLSGTRRFVVALGKQGSTWSRTFSEEDDDEPTAVAQMGCVLYLTAVKDTDGGRVCEHSVQPVRVRIDDVLKKGDGRLYCRVKVVEDEEERTIFDDLDDERDNDAADDDDDFVPGGERDEFRSFVPPEEEEEEETRTRRHRASSSFYEEEEEHRRQQPREEEEEEDDELNNFASAAAAAEREGRRRRRRRPKSHRGGVLGPSVPTTRMTTIKEKDLVSSVIGGVLGFLEDTLPEALAAALHQNRIQERRRKRRRRRATTTTSSRWWHHIPGGHFLHHLAPFGDFLDSDDDDPLDDDDDPFFEGDRPLYERQVVDELMELAALQKRLDEDVCFREEAVVALGAAPGTGEGSLWHLANSCWLSYLRTRATVLAHRVYSELHERLVDFLETGDAAGTTTTTRRSAPYEDLHFLDTGDPLPWRDVVVVTRELSLGAIEEEEDDADYDDDDVDLRRDDEARVDHHVDDDDDLDDDFGDEERQGERLGEPDLSAARQWDLDDELALPLDDLPADLRRDLLRLKKKVADEIEPIVVQHQAAQALLDANSHADRCRAFTHLLQTEQKRLRQQHHRDTLAPSRTTTTTTTTKKSATFF